jgi:TRAP-type C4-dicarboxylate transport system permease large subunit
MEEKMSKMIRMIPRRPVVFLVILAVFFVTAATVYGVLPVISLDSPTSFPVDI